MPSTTPNEPYRRTINFTPVADWRSLDVPASQDPGAQPFGPRPVLYVPVKKQAKQEKVPTLGIHIAFWEEGCLDNVRCPAHTGAAVTVSVFNMWGGKKQGPVVLRGAIDAEGICFIEVPSSTVAEWLDPGKKGTLGGRINELLLDFSFTSALKVEGQPLGGHSQNRLYLYRKKVIVFLPGVFGSQVHVQTPDGRTLGFPDYYEEPSTFRATLERALGPLGPVAGQAWPFLNQKVGGLECDADGEPLLRPLNKPTLLRLGNLKIYDTYEQCRQARMRYFQGVPAGFKLVEIRLHAYDWRCDLTRAAVDLAATLRAHQEELRKRPDTDDEVALAGHSTGGVIIRRALKEDGMQDLVSHAIFLNVPFRGAPKALGVMLTGKDPPGGSFLNRMIKFIDADSLRAMALGMPIVYHLAPSAAYPDRVAFTPNRPPEAAPAIEEEKHDLITTAIESGFLPPPRLVKAAGLSAEERARLAANADKWHEYWVEAHQRLRAEALYSAVYSSGHKRNRWFNQELRSRGLEGQRDARGEGGWNVKLAEGARRFHEESEELARSNQWADKAYIFYSVLPDKPTTLGVHFERVSDADFADLPSFLDAEGITSADFFEGDAVPRLENDEKGLGLIAHQWTVRGRKFRRTVWRVWGESGIGQGDGTVPTRSLLGFGGKATVLKPIEGAPDHVQAPNEPEVWDNVINILQGTLDQRKKVDDLANTYEGRPGAP